MSGWQKTTEHRHKRQVLPIGKLDQGIQPIALRLVKYRDGNLGISGTPGREQVRPVTYSVPGADQSQVLLPEW